MSDELPDFGLHPSLHFTYIRSAKCCKILSHFWKDCSKGPPLTLDWHFNPAGIYKVDEYEGNHQHRRNLRQMLISYNKRFEILQMGNPPVSMTEIKSVEKEMDRIKNQRQRTRAFLPYQKFEEVIQSTGRKVKRVTSNGNSLSQSSYS